MRIGNISISPWSRKNFLPRVFTIALVIFWIVGGYFVWRDGQALKESARAFKAQREERARQEQRARNEAIYRARMIEQQNQRNYGVQNVIDGVKK